MEREKERGGEWVTVASCSCSDRSSMRTERAKELWARHLQVAAFIRKTYFDVIQFEFSRWRTFQPYRLVRCARLFFCTISFVVSLTQAYLLSHCKWSLSLEQQTTQLISAQMILSGKRWKSPLAGCETRKTSERQTLAREKKKKQQPKWIGCARRVRKNQNNFNDSVNGAARPLRLLACATEMANIRKKKCTLTLAAYF